MEMLGKKLGWGTAGGALAGGALMGPAGALVGAYMGSDDVEHGDGVGPQPGDLQWQGAAGQDPNSILGAGLQANTKLATGGYDRLSQDALRTGPSAWRGMMDKQMEQRHALATDNLTQQQAGQKASAMNSLAMRGGLRGGSAERLAQGNQAQGLLARQGLARQGMADSLQADIQDESGRKSDLQSLLGQDLSRGQFAAQQQQFNIGNSLKEMQSKRDFEASQQAEKMKAWAAQKTAAAASDGGK